MACTIVDSARLTQLRERAKELRAELSTVEASIDAEIQMMKTATTTDQKPVVMMHHRPSYSLFGGLEGSESPNIRELEARDQDFDVVLREHPHLEVTPIGAFNHWDRRECAVPKENAGLWRHRCQEYMASLGGVVEIPKVIHQIWIGPREPPCLWIDTFRVEYVAEHPEWGFELWDDEKVSKLPMLNGKMYDEEKMWQCKADILRLEFLWHYGGVYVDADMISVGMKSLNPIVELGRETGFVIAYEPDTKDKPYSILGNSVIACTPHHPLTLMLILFLKQTYYQKRHHIDVFAVTGPVMYTKCLVDAEMPISVAKQELLYPAFHFVPNPDAINFAQFPKCLMFQFGYTCSGLEGYVKRKNKCKKARSCAFHSNKEWPFGRFRALPSFEQVEQEFAAKGQPAIPRVIHQFILDGADASNDPTRWRHTWFKDFCRDHPEFQYRTWTRRELERRSWLCANLYVEPFDDHAVTELMLEVIFEEGGYYVPLSTVYKPGAGKDPFFEAGSTDFVEGIGGIVGTARGAPRCFQRIMDLYNAGHVAPMNVASSSTSPRVQPMGSRDGTVSRTKFIQESTYLGAGQIVDLSGGGDPRLEEFCLSWAYQCMVPCVCPKGLQGIRDTVSRGALSTKAVCLVDKDIIQMSRLRCELPGFLDRLPHGCDIMLFGIEWQTGSNEAVLFQVPPGGRPQNAKVAGFVANFENASHMDDLCRTLQACMTPDGFDPSALFASAGRLSLWFGAEKYAGSIEEAQIWRSFDIVTEAFQRFAQHTPPMNFDNQELHGNLMKGTKNDGSLCFEISAEPNGGIMFRAWNEDNSTNCEMKSNGTAVEWMKVYFNHQIAFETQNQPL